MNLKETLLAEHSKAQANKIIAWVNSNQQRFDELFALFMSNEYRAVQRAAWPISYIVIAHPELIQKHFDELIKKLHEPGIHDAVKRNSIRLLQDMVIPEKFHGDVMNICFDFVASPKEKPAIKAFSLTVLKNLSGQYPDIKNELKLLIQSQWNNESAAFKSRARKLLKDL